jgi:homoaconitase/3-isopropylmalate dehydratase large subunit/3-isopropylmalate dehydratase small subunit
VYSTVEPMTQDLLSRPIEKRPATLSFPGRILYLVNDAELMRRQLFEGVDPAPDEVRDRLRDQVSTDEITPAYICYFFDETLGEFPYLGLRTVDRATGAPEFPVTRGSVKEGGFVCSVAGTRRGKGSSREQSPYAELMAGIRVVAAESIERIYNENCQNLGILTTTDFAVIERIRAGEEIPLEVFTRGKDVIAREIIEYGGLFEYNVARLQGKVTMLLPESLREEEGVVMEGDAGAVEPSAKGGAPVRDSKEIRQLRGSGEDGADATDPQASQLAATSQPTNPADLEEGRYLEAEATATPAGTDATGTPPAHGERTAPPGADDDADPAPGPARDPAGGPTGNHSRPMTVAEKIFASHWVVDAAADRVGAPWVRPGEAGFFRTDIRFSHEYVTPMSAIFFEEKMGSEGKVVDPKSVLFFRDHLTFLHKAMTQERIEEGLLDVANQLEVKQREFAERQGIKLYGEQKGHRMGSEAICHSKILEEYAEPGMLIIGSDSHTPHAGAIGSVAFGVGTTAIFNSWITKDVRVQVPRSFKVVVHGTPPKNVTAKDYMLEILRHPYIRDGHAIGQIIEYAGPAVEALSIDERATMTNMAAEVGAFTGIVAPDRKAVEYLVEERGLERERAERLIEGLGSDPGAEYVKVIEIDASEIRPMVALPGDPGNGRYISELEDEVGGGEPVRIDIAYAGSCTAGKKEDMDMYAAVFREAHEGRGLRVHPDVRCYIQCGSIEVREYCREKGYLDLFETVGAEFIEPGCGACINAGPGVTGSPEEVSVSSQNRNFPGRSGPGQLYLASPYSVAASAVAGRITEWEPGVPIEPVPPRGPLPPGGPVPPREPVEV